MGKSCFPLTPTDHKGRDCFIKTSQIGKIVKKLGFPDELDQSFISDAPAHEYLASLNDPSKTADNSFNLDSHFSNFDPELLKILKGMLEFNPYFRITAKEAL